MAVIVRIRIDADSRQVAAHELRRLLLVVENGGPSGDMTKPGFVSEWKITEPTNDIAELED
jgi:hypothetical protein